MFLRKVCFYKVLKKKIKLNKNVEYIKNKNEN